MDTVKEGSGGVVVGEKDACVPTVVHLEFPQDAQDLVCTKDNPNRPIPNSDLDMASLLLRWLVVDEVVPYLCHKNVVLYCDSSPTVSRIL